LNKSASAHFDQDGQLEIVAVAYFPDFDLQERQEFVYLKQEVINAYHLIILKDKMDARWITFEIGDIDVDGDLDLLLDSNGKYNNHSVNSPETKKMKSGLLSIIKGSFPLVRT